MKTRGVCYTNNPAKAYLTWEDWVEFHDQISAQQFQSIGKAFAEQNARIEALEQRLQHFGDRGPWKEGETYFENNIVSHNGSGWICKMVTTSRPGTDATWRLFVKSGRDADGEREPRRPSHRSRPLP